MESIEMTYVVYYTHCGAYHIDTFTEAEFDYVFEGRASEVNVSWMIV